MTEPHRVGNRYELGELLGRGGMAEVRKGTDVRLGRTVAVKRLRTDLASDATFQARFRREAQASASLNHPAIVSVYDTGEELSHDGTDVAQPYIVMEYVAGRTLRDILREGRKILPERALEITSGVLSALDYSHRMGIIHRDIKPGNVMLTPSGDVKVMDFGIARAVADAQSTMTQTAAVVGTAQYLSPEQARGETVDARSDVYSTGCLLYELLTGRPPFVGENPVSVAYQHVREQPNPPTHHDVDLPPEVDAIVMKALAKPVDERYPSAQAMKADIDRYLGGMPIQAPAVVPAAGAAAAGAAATTVIPAESPAEQTSEQEAVRKSRGPLWLIGLLALLLVAAAAFFLPRLLESAPEQVSVPSLQGMTRAQALSTLSDEGLDPGNITQAASEDVPKGRVISQNPGRGELVDPGSAIDFVISSGRPSVTIPDVIGDNKDSAESALRDLGLRVRLQERQSDENRDDVVAVDPGVGTEVSEGTQVTIFWSSGPTEVPNVVGRTEQEATRILQEAGFEVDRIEDSTTEATKGEVLQQSPQEGTQLNQGSTVTIVVSTYEEPEPTPTPTPTEPTDEPTNEPTDEPSTPVEPPA